MKLKSTLFAATAMALTAFGADAAEVKRLGLAVTNLQADYFNQIKIGVEEYAKELGIEVITVDAKNDGATQVSQVQDLLTQDIDALIYLPAGAAAAAVPARLAKAQGIPVVNVDRNADDEPGDTFIATDNATSAYEVCKHVIGLAGGAGKMIMIHGQKGTTPEVERTKGCMQAIGENPGVELVAQQWSNQWSQAEGLDISQNLLQANPDVTIIFGQADGLALGAAQGVKVSGVEQRVYIGGFDGDTTALPILAEGGFDATATQQVRGIGRLAVDSAVKLAAGETLPAEQLLPGYLTTPENAGEYVAEHP
ncbi:substrate-binding domain-containing protein [Donghicola tyrosinivorans]|uniref:Monosaccharide ABC transporter substrate-binding protein (CUT2 family) n=1 Tax=Donghicola tyrosinivorans TaxID=1652492 RepID=A0A2T0WNM5_9RHOB|nr:substrate-binding domain-containing protein [Donghicola tyrosinivorans]MEC9199012.1 substrate-binding domain-containing protein [Pseudomonadota bacterium]MEE3071880.1 substrate-binding domain-containing protein [Pseudomonadota bacterium]PRY88297.1 monosaccharide ABC transporter substrate-binding protein (CUT2 family) [Donghicola tyrosinivorans]